MIILTVLNNTSYFFTQNLQSHIEYMKIFHVFAKLIHLKNIAAS